MDHNQVGVELGQQAKLGVFRCFLLLVAEWRYLGVQHVLRGRLAELNEDVG